MDAIMSKIKNCMKIIARMLILLVPAFLISIQHLAADSPDDTSIGEAEKTDLGTGAIEPPDDVKNNPDLLYVLELLLRAPVTQLKDGEPPYDQEPPDAQDDFRTRTEPPTVPTEPPVIPTEPPTVPTEPPTIPTEPPTIPSPQPRPSRFPLPPINNPGDHPIRPRTPTTPPDNPNDNIPNPID